MELAGPRVGPLLVSGRDRLFLVVALSLFVAGAAGCSQSGRDAGSPPGEAAPLEGGMRFGGQDTMKRQVRSREEASGEAGGAPLADQAEAKQSPMIVRRAELTLRVDDVGKAAQALEDRAQAIGGYVAGSTLDRAGGEPSGQVVLRIPAGRVDDFLGGLSKLGTVLRQTMTAEDVGMEYHDLEAQLRNWKAEERRLQELFGRAAKVADLLEVERELARVRGQIDQATGRRDYLARQVQFATLTINLTQPSAPYTPPGWNALAVLREAGAALWETALGLITLAIWVLVFAPLWVPAWLLGRWLWRRRRKASKPT